MKNILQRKRNPEGQHKKISFFIELIGAIIGAIGGYIYFRFYACSSGSCPLTSNPWICTLWGAIMGYLLFGIFKPSKKIEEKNQ